MYLPTMQPFYETKESKYVYHLRCPESKYTYYWDANIVVVPEIAQYVGTYGPLGGYFRLIQIFFD